MVCIREFDVVEEAPSHDGTPCFSAWRDYETLDENYAGSDFSNGRPKFSIQIYDTTPDSRNPQHIKALAEHIHLATYKGRSSYEVAHDDRLDVYGLALPVDIQDEERMSQCIAHQKAEIISRNSSGKSDFYIPGTFSATYHRRVLVIIRRPMDQWDVEPVEEREKPFWVVFWGLPKATREQYRLGGEHFHFEDPDRDLVSFDALGGFLLQHVKTPIRWFTDCYVFDGLLDREIARYVKRREERAIGVDMNDMPGGGGASEGEGPSERDGAPEGDDIPEGEGLLWYEPESWSISGSDDEESEGE